MADKNIFDVMKEKIAEDLNSITFELLAVEDVVKKNADGTETFETKLHLEIPKGNERYSRLRIAVKIPRTSKFSSINFDETEVFITLSGTKISFIDSKGNVYFKADYAEIV